MGEVGKEEHGDSFLARRLGWDLAEAFRPFFDALHPEAELDPETAWLLSSSQNAVRLLRGLLRSRGAEIARARVAPLSEIDHRTLNAKEEAVRRLDESVPFDPEELEHIVSDLDDDSK